MPPQEEWVPVMMYVRNQCLDGGSKYAIMWVELPASMYDQHVEECCVLCRN